MSSPRSSFLEARHVRRRDGDPPGRVRQEPGEDLAGGGLDRHEDEAAVEALDDEAVDGAADRSAQLLKRLYLHASAA